MSVNDRNVTEKCTKLKILVMIYYIILSVVYLYLAIKICYNLIYFFLCVFWTYVIILKCVKCYGIIFSIVRYLICETFPSNMIRSDVSNQIKNITTTVTHKIAK